MVGLLIISLLPPFSCVGRASFRVHIFIILLLLFPLMVWKHMDLASFWYSPSFFSPMELMTHIAKRLGKCNIFFQLFVHHYLRHGHQSRDLSWVSYLPK